MDPETVGVLHLFRDYSRTGGARFPFAYEVVAVALTKKRQHHETEQEFIEKALTFLRDAAEQALNAMVIVILSTVVARFRGQ